MSETASPEPIRTAPRALWLVAQGFLHTLFTLFGDPSRIAFQHTLTKKPYQLLLSWIRCGEAMMRRLLLIEAAAYPKPNTPPRLWPKRMRVRKLVGFDDDNPGRGAFRSGVSTADRRLPAGKKQAGKMPAVRNVSIPPGRSRSVTKRSFASSTTPRRSHSVSPRDCMR